MKIAFVGVAVAVSLGFAEFATAQIVTPIQNNAAREAALKYCTEYTKKNAGKRSDDQNQRVAVFKDCMVTQGQRP